MPSCSPRLGYKEQRTLTRPYNKYISNLITKKPTVRWTQALFPKNEASLPPRSQDAYRTCLGPFLTWENPKEGGAVSAWMSVAPLQQNSPSCCWPEPDHMPALNQSLARGVGSQEGNEVSLLSMWPHGKHWVLQEVEREGPR